jgi:REP element-mobilizing transposase RayT
MSRPLRVERDNACYHVTSRGNRRATIFHSDSDRLTWLAMLAETCKRFDFVVLSYCLMGNHYHLVVQTLSGQLSRGMRYLNSNYSQYFNRQHGLTGHLFQGRYHAILCQQNEYLDELLRYTVLNPVRAGLVTHPGHWPWSSYQPMIGGIDAPEWLQRDTMLRRFGSDHETAVLAYETFVLEGIGRESPFQVVRHQLFLGDEAFCERVECHIFSRDLKEVNRVQRRAVALPLADYFALYPNRKEAMARAYLSHNYSMTEVADYCGVSIRTVSRAVKAHRRMSDCQT